jgi:hypothetical protein
VSSPLLPVLSFFALSLQAFNLFSRDAQTRTTCVRFVAPNLRMICRTRTDRFLASCPPTDLAAVQTDLRTDLCFLWLDPDRPYPLGDINAPFPTRPATRAYILEKIQEQFGVAAVPIAADLPLKLH